MSNHPGDSVHRYKGHPKTPKPPKCRHCRQVASRDELVRVGGSRYHADCVDKRHQ